MQDFKNKKKDPLDLMPKEIVSYLDNYIIGQKDAKKAVALALRNRYRRSKVEANMQEVITPKNILMIGSTGVGKTEIARRLAKLLKLPFVKVEASKYTEVGFVGRDVESMIRDLVSASVNLTEKIYIEENQDKIEDYVLDLITKQLLPPLPSSVSEEKSKAYEESFLKLKQKVKEGQKDEVMITVEISSDRVLADNGLPPDMLKMQESLIKVLAPKDNMIKKEVSIKEAKTLLQKEASKSILDADTIHKEALKKASEHGIIFIDEIDKIATAKSNSRQDPSKEGVQRDLLPIIEGSVVNTKYGQISTDHILFIAAGAFAFSKPSDLIPELQGRFPIRVELDNLNKDDLLDILIKTKNSLIIQYQTLLKVDEVVLKFDDDALSSIAEFAHLANEKTEDIGARRLATVLEKILEEVSFNADEFRGKDFVITKDYVEKTLNNLIENIDLARYIL